MGKHSKKRDFTRAKQTAFVAATVATLLGGGTATAFADPDFGTGGSSKGPQDSGALCHPPGQTVDFPACK